MFFKKKIDKNPLGIPLEEIQEILKSTTLESKLAKNGLEVTTENLTAIVQVIDPPVKEAPIKNLHAIVTVKTYLPEQVSEEDLRKRIQEVITETGAQGMKDFGKIMKTLVPEFKGKADNAQIKELANEYLS